MTLTMNLKEQSYGIVIERGALSRVGELFPLDRRVLIVTDEGVPAALAATVAPAAKAPLVKTVAMGEGSKSFATLEMLLTAMLRAGFTRTDAVVAVGGGVVGDLAGFAAATYMRGIDFYNIPTTLLSQVDSSIGGKTAVNLGGVKNCIGAFYQPKGVLVDPDVLCTLPKRQIANGLAEAIKMAACCDEALFSLMEQRPFEEILDAVIEGSLRIKKRVVEQDATEKSLRRVLNFGHTFGHGIESAAGLHSLLHGECVALGMLPLCSPAARRRLLPVLKKAGLPTRAEFDLSVALDAMAHDKKMAGSEMHYVYLPEIGRFELKKAPLDDVKAMIKEAIDA